MSLQEYFNYNINFNTSNSLTLGQATIASLFSPGSGSLTHTINTFGNIFTNSGNVGIGTTAPTFKLDVNGSTRIVSGLTSTFNSNTFGPLITTGGNIGIGTVAPSYTLDVSGSGRFSNNLLATFNSNTLGNIFTTGGNVGIGTTAPAYTLDVNGTFEVSNSNGLILFASSGNVGIGTTSPSALLNAKLGTNLNSSGQPSGNWAGIIYNATNSPGYNGLLIKNNWNDSASTVLEVGLDFVGMPYKSFLKVDGAGNVGIGTTAPVYKLQVNGDISFPYGNAIYVSAQVYPKAIESVWQNSQDQLVFYTPGANSNTAKLCLQHNGNVGIGTTAPVYKLDVSGSLRTTGPGGVGTNGSALITGGDSFGHSLYIASSTGTQKRIGFNHNGTTGNIFAYDYGASAFQNLILQSPGGNVGIGTQTPSNLLQVNGIAALGTLVGNVTSQTANDTLYLGTTGNTNFFIDRPTGNSGGSIILGYNTAKTTERSLLTIYNNSTDRNVIFNAQSKGASGTDLIHIPVGLQATFNSNTIGNIFTIGGNVGIGTGNPTQMLHIQKFGSDNYIKVDAGATNSNNYAGIMFTEHNINFGWSLRFNALNDGLYISHQDNTPAFTDLVSFDRANRVGINTTSPAYTLDVGGTIARSGVKLPRFDNGTFSGSSFSIPILFNDTQYNYVEFRVRYTISALGNVNISATSYTNAAMGFNECALTTVKWNLQNSPDYQSFTAVNSGVFAVVVESAGIDNNLTFRITRASGTSRNHYSYDHTYCWGGVGTARGYGQGHIVNASVGGSPIQFITFTPASGTVTGTYSTVHYY